MKSEKLKTKSEKLMCQGEESRAVVQSSRISNHLIT